MSEQFIDFGLLPQLEANLAKLNYETPTPIQAQAIPSLLAGRDLLGIAQTGTGKTAAFSLPLLHRLGQHKQRMRPGECRSLILAPTRELASQIHKDLKAYGQGLGLKVEVIFGGIKQHSQVQSLNQGLDILVATPGRLEDLIQQGHAKLGQVNCLILDEADRMLDMGFLPPIRRIIGLLPKQRQTMLFSATMPTAISQLIKNMMNNPAKVEVSPESTTVDRIRQQVIHVPQTEKLKLLKEILVQDEVEQAIIFSRTKHGAERLSKGIRAMQIPCESIHGNKSQSQRERALEGFKAGKLRFLVATDIAARGLDVAGVTHVINYDLPAEPEAYVHRIGRTGRAGREGVAISFCSLQEEKHLKAIEKTIGLKLPLGNLSRAEWNPGKIEVHLHAKSQKAPAKPKINGSGPTQLKSKKNHQPHGVPTGDAPPRRVKSKAPGPKTRFQHRAMSI